MPTDMPSKEEILNHLIKSLFKEIQCIRKELNKAHPKKRPTLRRELRKSSLALADLLQALPEESDMDEWLRIIQEKAPKKFAKHVYSFIKFSGKVMRDEEVSKRRGLKDS